MNGAAAGTREPCASTVTPARLSVSLYAAASNLRTKALKRRSRGSPTRCVPVSAAKAASASSFTSTQLSRGPVRKRLGDVRGLNPLHAGQGRKRLRDAARPRPPSARQRHPLDRAVEERLSGRRPFGGRPGTRGLDPRPHGAGRLRRACSELLSARPGPARGRSDRGAHVRACRGRPRAVAANRSTPPPGRLGAAGAQVHSRDELEASREDRSPCRTCDRHLAVLDRLAKRLERRPLELGQLVEQEDSAVCERDLTRPMPGLTAADHRGHRGAVVRRPNGRRMTSGCSGRAGPRPTGCVTSIASSSASSAGRIPGSRRASIVLPVPGGPARRVGPGGRDFQCSPSAFLAADVGEIE